MAQAVLDALAETFGDAIIESQSTHGDESCVVSSAKLSDIATWLRDAPAMAFDMPIFCTCIDLFDMADDGPRFEVCYQLRSTKHRHRIRLKVRLEEKTPKCPSLADVWPGMNWLERETFDMYGIEFEGHPDLRRIYMYDEFEGHPLRKDYPKDKRQPLVRREWTDEPLASEQARVSRKVSG